MGTIFHGLDERVAQRDRRSIVKRLANLLNCTLARGRFRFEKRRDSNSRVCALDIPCNMPQDELVVLDRLRECHALLRVLSARCVRCKGIGMHQNLDPVSRVVRRQGLAVRRTDLRELGTGRRHVVGVGHRMHIVETDDGEGVRVHLVDQACEQLVTRGNPRLQDEIVGFLKLLVDGRCA